jgi:hypothetical protein
MDRLVWLAIFVTILFVLTYDPKAGTLEKYIAAAPVQEVKENKRLSGGVNDFRSCENTKYQALQFGELNPQCPSPNTKTVDGVIV